MKESVKNKLQKLRNYVDGKADSFFEYFILLVIIINSVSLGLETSVYFVQYKRMFYIIDQICLWIFIIELTIKAAAFNKDFFKYKWNIFDLVIVSLSIISSFPYFTVFRAFRIFRSIRVLEAMKAMRAVKVLKLINGLENLQIILKAIIYSIPGIIWTCILLFILFYIYAITGTFIFGIEFPDLFGSLGKSLYTMFQLMLFDDFGNITRAVMSYHNWSWLYFISFAIISAFIIMNIIVGIVVDSIEEVRLHYVQEENNKKQITLELISAQIAELQKQIEKIEKK